MGIMLSPEMLRRYVLFAGFDHCTIQSLAMAGTQVAFSQGEWIFYEGTQADALYVVADGTVELKVALDHERSCHVDLCTLVEGDLLGWSALVEPGIYRLSAIAVEDSTLARWDGVELARMMTHQPAMGLKLMCRVLQVMGSRLDEFCIRFASLVEGDQWQSLANRQSSSSANQN